MKQKICLVCDMKDWAFDFISHEIESKLKNKYDFVIEYLSEYDAAIPGKLYDFFENHKEFDLIHFFWRKTLLPMETEDFSNSIIQDGKNYKQYIEQIKKKITIGIYDFLYLDNEENKKVFKNIINNLSLSYYVNSKKLYNEYLKMKDYRKPSMIVCDIFNSNVFKAEKLDRFLIENINNRPLVVGWVGNSKREENGIDLKGLRTIIKPIIKELNNEGYNFIEKYADRNEKWRSNEEMPKYYSEIDICLITSIHEGTPRPALESMSCGVPLISTDVGIIQEVFGKKQKKFIIGSRKYGKNDDNIRKSLKEKLIELYNHRELFEDLSKENQESIRNYLEKNNVKQYDDFFSMCLKIK